VAADVPLLVLEPAVDRGEVGLEPPLQLAGLAGALGDDAVAMEPEVGAGMALAAGRHGVLLVGAPAGTAPAG